MLLSYLDKHPHADPSAFVEESARLIGEVSVGPESSIWFNTVLRGDIHFIRIGCRSNIQDGSVLHVTRGLHPTIVGDDVTVGHNVTLHGCRIGNCCLIGMGAVVMDGAEIGEESIVAAGSVVSPGTIVPPRSMVVGLPARIKRSIKEEEIARLKESAANYVEYMRTYMQMAVQFSSKEKSP